jgi:hypothetical protein
LPFPGCKLREDEKVWKAGTPEVRRVEERNSSRRQCVAEDKMERLIVIKD